MALSVLPSAPTVSGVYQIRDFVPELNESTKSNATALQNAFKFGTKVHDYMKSRKQSALMKKDSEDFQALKKSIEDDKSLLVELKKELATLQGGEQ